jgi:hypothetical protein
MQVSKIEILEHTPKEIIPVNLSLSEYCSIPHGSHRTRNFDIIISKHMQDLKFNDLKVEMSVFYHLFFLLSK